MLIMKSSVVQYHLAKNGQELGVLKEKDIKKAYSEGQIDGDVLVWREGMKGWVTIFDVFPQWKPTEAQIRFLSDCHIEISSRLTKLEASRLLEERPPSDWQLRVLRKIGLGEIGKMTGKEAKIRIDQFSAQQPERYDQIRGEIRVEEAREKYETMILNMPGALKNELLEIQKEDDEEAKEIEELKEEIKKAERELIELQKKKLEDQEDAEELTKEINELEESIKDQKKEIQEMKESLPESRKERSENRREVEKGRVSFWVTTILSEAPQTSDEDEHWLYYLEMGIENGQPSPPSSFPPAKAFETPSSRELYSNYGHLFSKPQKVQVSKVLKALDEVDIRWEDKDISLFFQTLENWFPELKN